MAENFEELAATIEQKLAAVAADRTASEKAREEKLAAIGAKQQELAHSFLELEQKLARAPEHHNAKADTLGARVIASGVYGDFAAGRTHEARIPVGDSLAAILTPANAATQTLPGVYGNPELPTDVEAVFPHVAVSSNSIEYQKATTETNAFGPVAEGAQKPEGAYGFKTETANVRTIAAWVKVSRQLAEDAPAVESYINNRMIYNLRHAIEKQLVAGTGAGQDLPGIFTKGNYTAHGLSGTVDPLDVVRKAALKVRTAGFAPSILFVNPADYDDLIAQKDKQGRYLISNPTAAATPAIWGLRPVQSVYVTPGQFLVADPSVATVYDRMADEIRIFEQDGNNVELNLVTIRAERRLGFGIENVAGLVGGALAVAA
nr:MAG TPA: major capsid protein [Caudoviricetes sp.]